jgi:O-antigen ligase
VVAAVALACWVRPFVPHRSHRALDAALIVVLLVGAGQLVPIDPALREALSPAADAIDAALLLIPAEGRAPSGRTISIDPSATRWAIAYAAACLLLFWCTRTTLERNGGLRPLCRSVAWFGLVASALTFVQRALAPGLMYGVWRPVTRASQPTAFGPFVNRNDLATWLILAAPLVLGYALAHLETHGRNRYRQLDFESIVGPRMLTLVASVGLMTALLLALATRSALAGLGVGLICFVAAARRRLGGRRVVLLLGGIAAVVLIGTSYANMPVLAARIGESLPSGLGGRIEIWRETWPMARDFALAGAGLGGFERTMLVYQQSPRDIFFNHAHNEYLQIFVEGGSLLVIPAAIALVAGTAAIARQIQTDTTPVFWIRAGAAAALVAVATQSLFDTGLRMPANAVLFAIVAAVALHRRDSDAALTSGS